MVHTRKEDVLADNNQHIQIRKEMAEFFSVVLPTMSPYHNTLVIKTTIIINLSVLGHHDV